jgi:hypothetical protein
VADATTGVAFRALAKTVPTATKLRVAKTLNTVRLLNLIIFPPKVLANDFA